MARFEVGNGGNPHYHGFGMGLPGPQVKRVKADVEGEDDLPPQTVTEDLRVVRRALRAGDGGLRWEYDEDLSAEEARQRLRRVLGEDDEGQKRKGIWEFDSESDESDSGRADVAEGRVQSVLNALVEFGEISEIPGEGEGEKSDVRYRRVPPVPEVQFVRERRARGRPAGVRGGSRGEKAM